MMDTDILDMLDEIGRTSTARLSPAVHLTGANAAERSQSVLRAIRGTILPRRIEFNAANGESLVIEVNSSRVTDVFKTDPETPPDFETEHRDALTEKLAQLVTAIAAAPGPIEILSLRPDSNLKADDVGITLSEIESACEQIELPSEPRTAVVADTFEQTNTLASVEKTPATPSPNQSTMAHEFYEGSDRFAIGRILVDGESFVSTRSGGICEPDQPLHPSQGLLDQLSRDLAGWDADGAATQSHPQLIVMRPSGGKGVGLAILRDEKATVLAPHETRRLGAVLNLWKSIKGTGR